MDIVVIMGVESDGIFVDVVTEGIDPDVSREVCVFGDDVVGVLDAFVTVGFVVVLDAFVIVGFVVVLDAFVIVGFVVVLDVFVIVGFVVVLNALIMVVFVVVMDAFVIVGFAVVMVAVVRSLVDAAVDVEVVVVMGVVCVFGDGVAGFCHEPEIRKDVSWLLRDKCATKSVVIRQGYLF